MVVFEFLLKLCGLETVRKVRSNVDVIFFVIFDSVHSTAPQNLVYGVACNTPTMSYFLTCWSWKTNSI